VPPRSQGKARSRFQVFEWQRKLDVVQSPSFEPQLAPKVQGWIFMCLSIRIGLPNNSSRSNAMNAARSSEAPARGSEVGCWRRKEDPGSSRFIQVHPGSSSIWQMVTVGQAHGMMSPYLLLKQEYPFQKYQLRNEWQETLLSYLLSKFHALNSCFPRRSPRRTVSVSYWPRVRHC
jgi:hypothetical protein